MSPPGRFAGHAVLELATGFGSATLAAKLLADVGCPVYKLEPPSGDPLRAGAAPSGTGMDLFHLVSGSKQSACCDLGHPAARAVLDAILARVEIVVADRDGMAALARLYPDGSLAEKFPRVTLAACTPFGTGGAQADWKAGEEGLQAMSGIMSTTGHPGRPPVRVAGAIVTHVAAMYAATSILADLRAKESSGRGGHLDLAMFDAAISLLTSAFPAYFLSGRSPEGLGNRHLMAAPWNTYPCSDGWVVICAGNEPTWQRLVTAIGRADLARDPQYATQEARVRNVAALDAEIGRWTAVRTAHEVEAELDAQGIPSGPILALADVLAHPQFVARGLLRRDDGVAITGGVFHRDGRPLAIRAGAASLGAATRRLVVDHAGIEPAQYERWLRDAVLREDTEAAHAAAA